MKQSIRKNYGQLATWLLVIYLSVMVSGCAVRPAELSPEAARSLQTRELNYSVDEVARGVVAVLQEMHYSLGNVDMGMGLITAERSSERSLAPISKEVEPETEVPDEVQTFCLVAGGLAIAALLFAWLWDDDDDDGDWGPRRNSRHHHNAIIHHHPGPIFIDGDDYSPDSYKYNMTVILEELGSYKSRIRVTVQGQYMEGSGVSASGPIHDEEFYADFYKRLNLVLNQ